MTKSTPTVKQLATAALVWGCVTGLPVQSQTITLGSLLDDMVNADQLTRLPSHPYRLLHASSYDRRAQQPYTLAWFSNSDWGMTDGTNYIRKEVVNGRTEFVLMDAEGPGAIVRFWLTTWQDGAFPVLRIYLDHEPTPVIEGALTQLIGRNALTERPLSFLSAYTTGVYTYLVGHNFYMPIPFASHCKVTVETPSSRMYYNIDYRHYDTPAPVESYTTNSLTSYHSNYCNTLSALSNAHPTYVNCSTTNMLPNRIRRETGVTEFQLAGPALIRQLTLQIYARDILQALRSTHLEIDFDGETHAVHCPLGDFFGIGGASTTGSTWFTEVQTNHCLHAFWPMPFQRSATIRLANHGRQPVDLVLGTLAWSPYEWATNSLHFHAAWREYAFEDSISSANGWRGEDLNYISLKGTGRLVGDSLSIFNDVSTNNPRAWDNWWGEGDEKIYVDGEPFPSHFGTGTEDYYGYAWCGAYLFNTPFVSLPIGYGNDQTGKAINTRVRLLDDLPYRSSLVFDMELMHNRAGRHRFAPTVFWYALPGGTCQNPDPLAVSQLPVAQTKISGFELATNTCPIGLRQDFDQMSMQNMGGLTSIATTNGWGLSQEKCLFWKTCPAGASLTLEFRAAFTGECALIVKMIALPTSGSLSVSLNGTTLTHTLVLAGEAGRPCTLPLGRHVLLQGINQLRLEVEELPSGQASADFVFDYLENVGPYDISRLWPWADVGTLIRIGL